MNEKIEIEVRKRKLTVEVEGFQPFEIVALAKDVEKRMLAIEEKYGIPDSSKLGILTALEYAAEIKRLLEAHENARLAAEKRLEVISHTLKAALGAAS